jgi:hypothetical protein
MVLIIGGSSLRAWAYALTANVGESALIQVNRRGLRPYIPASGDLAEACKASPKQPADYRDWRGS